MFLSKKEIFLFLVCCGISSGNWTFSVDGMLADFLLVKLPETELNQARNESETAGGSSDAPPISVGAFYIDPETVQRPEMSVAVSVLAAPSEAESGCAGNAASSLLFDVIQEVGSVTSSLHRGDGQEKE